MANREACHDLSANEDVCVENTGGEGGDDEMYALAVLQQIKTLGRCEVKGGWMMVKIELASCRRP